MSRGRWKFTYGYRDLSEISGLTERQVQSRQMRGEFIASNFPSVVAWLWALEMSHHEPGKTVAGMRAKVQQLYEMAKARNA